MQKMPFLWKQKSIGDLLEAIIDYRGKTPPKAPFGIPTITAANIKNGRIDLSSVSYVSQETYDKWITRGLPKPGDIIITTEAPVGEVASLPDDQTYLITRRVMALRGKNGTLDNRFLKYSLLDPRTLARLLQATRGSTVPRVLKTDITNFIINLPPLPEQKAIAHILGTLDDKIELNNKMNQTLEAIAQAIFKSWFVDFDPVRAKMDGQQPVGMDAATAELFPDYFEDSELGKIPKGWEVRKLGEIAENKSRKFDFIQNQNVVFINTGDVLEGRFLHSNIKNKNELPGQAKKAICNGDILISEIRPGNKRYAIVDFDSSNYVVSTKFMVICSLNQLETKLLYRILVSDETLAEFQMIAESRSGTFPQITFDSISYFPIICPPKILQKIFLQIINPLEKRIKSNELESKTLSNLRDTLLPKLMSGEIRVAEAEKQVENVL
ncbi:MAG: restriction endonuclease subunit S [Microcoleaceae cyanobacterium]